MLDETQNKSQATAMLETTVGVWAVEKLAEEEVFGVDINLLLIERIDFEHAGIINSQTSKIRQTGAPALQQLGVNPIELSLVEDLGPRKL